MHESRPTRIAMFLNVIEVHLLLSIVCGEVRVAEEEGGGMVRGRDGKRRGEVIL